MNFVTIAEASRKTGIKQEKLRKAVRLGLISSYPLGNRRLVDLDTLPREVVSVENLIGVRELADRAFGIRHPARHHRRLAALHPRRQPLQVSAG